MSDFSVYRYISCLGNVCRDLVAAFEEHEPDRPVLQEEKDFLFRQMKEALTVYKNYLPAYPGEYMQGIFEKYNIK